MQKLGRMRRGAAHGRSDDVLAGDRDHLIEERRAHERLAVVVMGRMTEDDALLRRREREIEQKRIFGRSVFARTEKAAEWRLVSAPAERRTDDRRRVTIERAPDRIAREPVLRERRRKAAVLEPEDEHVVEIEAPCVRDREYRHAARQRSPRWNLARVDDLAKPREEYRQRYDSPAEGRSGGGDVGQDLLQRRERRAFRPRFAARD